MLLVALVPVSAWCQPGLADASLEQLLDIQVTSVSKKEQKLARTAAAVFVISQDDIRRSGAISLPDLLRMVPGINVSQIDANAWAISIRGFATRYSSKLLVLIDGRSVYTPSFSGVFWDQVDLPLQDIDRIEVIRGPGATVWGANAVNGVINIITKSSLATQGGLLEVAAGNSIEPITTLRYGGKIGSAGAFRAFTRYSKFADGKLGDGALAADGWSRTQGGFRTDWDLGQRDAITVQGALFANRGSHSRYHWFLNVPSDLPFAEKLQTAGGDFEASWTHTSATGAETSLRGYFDSYRRVDLGTVELSKTLDFDFQNHFHTLQRHDIVWGSGFRTTYSGVPAGSPVELSPTFRTDRLYNVFLQDEIAFSNQLWLTVGSKVEHNAYSGFEYEPSVRVAWNPSSRNTLWGAASRAIRQPMRAETGISLNLLEMPLDANTVFITTIAGNPRFRSEELNDLEVGYRAVLTRRVSLDMDGFWSLYRHLQTIELQPQTINTKTLPVHVVMPFVYGNKGRANNYGAELSLEWSVTSRWRLAPGYAFLQMNGSLEPGCIDPFFPNLVHDSPRNSFQLRSTGNVTRTLEWEYTAYWSSAFSQGTVPHHLRFDARLAWRPLERIELSLAGQNLLRPGFIEFTDTAQIAATQARRAIFGKVSWRF